MGSLMPQLLIALYTAAAVADSTPDAESIVLRNEPAVLVIVGEREENGASVQSSGCCVHTNGYILTTAHQITGVHRLKGRLPSGAEFALATVELDEQRELALLKADAPLPRAVTVGDSTALRSGAPLISIAAPLSLDYSTVTGTVSNPNRSYNGYPVIQAELRAAPGSSGGPVFDRRGMLVGMIIGKLSDQDWITVVNPINNARPMLRRHGLLPSQTAKAGWPGDSLALVPARDITEAEGRAIEAYNNGVAAAETSGKTHYYRLASRLLPEFYEAWFNLAITLSAAQDPKGAEEAYQRAEALREEAVEAPRNLGRLLLKTGRTQEALARFVKARRLAPAEPQSHNDLGETYRILGEPEKAVQSFEAALQLDTRYPAAHFNLALTCANNGHAKRAVEHFETYLALAPHAADAGQVRQWIQQLQRQP